MILKADKGHIIEFTNPIDRHIVCDFTKTFVFSMEIKEWNTYLKGQIDGQLRQVPVRIIPNTEAILYDATNNEIGKIGFLDIYISLAGELIPMDKSKSRCFQQYEKGQALAETKSLTGVSLLNESTYLNFVDAGDNIVRVTCSITEANKIKYENTELWEIHPSFADKINK